MVLLGIIVIGLTTCDMVKAGLGPQIDVKGPSVSVKSIASGAYLKGTVTLTGEASDVNGISSVSIVVSINDSVVGTIPATLTSTGWSASLDTKALSGGKDTQATLDIKVTASSGKVTDENFVVYFENTPPVFSTMTPSQAQLGDNTTYDYAISQIEAITGSVNSFGLNTVELDLGSGKNIVKSQTTKSAFSFQVDASQFFNASTYAAQNGASSVSGSGSSQIYAVPYALIATDLAGNATTISGKLYVEPGVGAPIVTFTSPASFDPVAYYPYNSAMGSVNSIKPGTTLSFHAFDMDGLDRSTAGLYVAYASGASGPDYADAFNPASPGKYTVLTDGNGLTVTPSATLQLSGSTTAITQGADISFSLPTTVGQYALIVHVADLASNKISGAAASYSIPPSPYASTGSCFFSLFVSNGNPQVTVSLGDGSFVTGLNVTGTVVDASGPIGIDIGLVETSPTAQTIIDITKNASHTVTVRANDPSTADWSYAASPALSDGTYTLSLVGINSSYAQTSPALQRTFTVDTTPPTTTISVPGSYTSSQSQYWLSGATMSISGTANDGTGSGVASVYYTIVPKGTAQPAFPGSAWTLTAGTGSWNGTVNLSSLSPAEGEFTLYIIAMDTLGNTTTTATSRNFGVDQNPPTLTETNHPATSYTKSTFTLAGTAGDTNALASLTITESKNGGTAQSVSYTPSATIAGAKSATYATVSLPLGGVADGSYAYVLTATDVAGKVATVNRTIKIDTTPPTVTLNAIPAWVSSAAYTISGTGTDPNASSASGVASVQYELDGGTTWTTATWTDTSGGANTSGTWNATLSGLAEGNHSIVVQATDAAGNSTKLSAVSFGVDLNPPTLTETSISSSAQVIKNTGFTLTGTVGDTNPASIAGSTLTVSVSVNGAAATAATLSGSTWSYTQPKVDGTYSYTITATDVAGKTTSLNRLVLLDSTPPTLTVISPTSGSWTSAASLSLSGTANDGAGSGVSKVYVKIDGPYVASSPTDHSGEDPTVAANGWTPATGTTNWAASLLISGEGWKSLWVKASDVAGNVTTPAQAVSGIVKVGLDLSPPALTVGAVTGTINAAAAKAFAGFSGTIFDTNPAGLPNLQVSYTGPNVISSATIAYTGTSLTSPGNTWSWNPFGTSGIDTVNNTDDGAWTFTFTATDVAGKTNTVSESFTIDTKPPVTAVTSPAVGAWVSSTALTVTGSATDGTGTGVAAVYVKADGPYVAGSSTDHSKEDPAVAANGWTLATGTTSWNASLTLSGEGYKTLWVKSRDVAGNHTSPSQAIAQLVNFGLDLSPPSIAFTDSVGTLVNSGFTLTGSISDSNPASVVGSSPTLKLAVTIDGVADPGVTVTSGSPNSWSVPIAVNATTHANDGAHTYVFTATDVAGKTTTLSRTITIDTTPPTVTVSQPGTYTSSQSQYWLSGSTALLGGTAADLGSGASDVAKVYYKVDTLATSHASDSSSTITNTWALAAGTTTWSATVNLGTIGEGQFTLWTAAYDNAGNLSAIGSRNFGVDQNPPTLTETNHPATSYTKASYTLAGLVGDTNALASLTITESKNGGTASSVSFTSTPTSLTGVQSATYTTVSLPLGGVADGSYAYVLTATDVAGKVATVNRTIKIDTTPPTVTLNAIPAWVSSAAYTISGTGTDPNASSASGVASVQYELDGGTTWTTATWTDTSGGANTSGTWNATLSGLAEGNHSIVVQATDAAGNSTKLSAVSFGVDLNPPTLTETSISSSAQVIKNTGFTLTGTVGDTNSASIAGSTLTVSVSVNGAAATAATLSGSTWSYTQPKVDGTYSYTITATDVAGKTTTVNRLVLLDSTPPTLSVASPTPGTWTSSTSLSISGSANDGAGSGVAKSYYLVDSIANDHSADIATWNATNGSAAPTGGAWTATGGLPTSWTGSATLSSEGYKRLWVVTVDNAGNTSTLAIVPATSIVVGTTYTIDSVGSTDFRTFGATSNTVGLSFIATTAGTVGSGTGTAWTGTGKIVSFGLDLSPPSLTETAINTVTTVVRNSSVTFSGLVSDTDALASTNFLTVSVDGGTAIAIPFTTAPAWSYTYTVNTSTHAEDGTHGFVFTAMDIAGKTTTVSRSVLVDTTPATVAVSAPTASSWTNATPYTVAGTASDGAGAGIAQVWTIVDNATVSHASDATTAITTGGSWKQASGTTNWTASWPISGDGNKTLWVAVLDLANNWTITYTRLNFGFDATPPTLAITPMGGFRAAFSITGTAADSGSGLASLQYKVDSGSFSPITVAASWTTTLSADAFAALTEGTHTVTVQAFDVAGNQTTLSSTFLKDISPPVVSYSNISSSGGTVVQNSSPSLTGTMTDASGVASATYTLQVWNYSTQTWNTITTGASLGSPANSTNWSWSLDLSSAGLNLPDGKYQIAIGATDVPGNAIALPTQVYFLLSRTNPGATVTAPGLGTFQNAAFPLVGTASDPNGITQVVAQIATGSANFSSGTTAAYPALPVTVATGSPGVFTTASPHGLNVNDQVYIWASPMPVTPTGSLAASTVYYVQSVPSTTSFTISATSGGAAISINTSTATNVLVGIAKDTFSTFHPSIPVTVNASTNTMTAANHGLSNGDIVYFQGTTLPSSTNSATPYYVVNTATSTFQVSTMSGGSALALGSAGTSVSVWSPTHAVNWLIPTMLVSGFSDGALTAYVQVTSGSGKTNQTSQSFTLDTTPPVISVSTPGVGTRWVGNLTIIGTTTDPGSLPSGVTGTIQYQIGNGYSLTNASSWTSANVSGGSYSWTISLGDMSAYANASFATQCDTSGNAASGTNLWKLPIVFQALDKAGNVAQLTTYYLILDPNGNIPVVTITQPATGLTFGGQQRITGTATQPTWIYGVEVAIDPNNGSNFPANPVSVSISGSTLTATSQPFTAGQMVFLSGTTAPQVGGTSVASTTAYWVVNPTTNTFQVSATSGGSAVTFSSSGSGVTASVWAPATLMTTGNNVTWYYDVNTTTAYPQNAATSQTISLQVRAWNSPTAGGVKGTLSGTLTNPLIMTFNSSFPQLQNVQINGASYYSQIMTRGTISLTATVSSSKGISKLESVESSPLSGSTTLYSTASSYAATAASNGSYWSSTVTPPTQYTAGSFPYGGSYKLMITSLGTTNWVALGAAAGAGVGTVFSPSGAGSGTGTAFASDSSGNFNYSVAMTLTSTALYSNTTGQYAFNFRMTDMTSPTSQVATSMVTLDEDNYYPTSTLSNPAPVTAGSLVTGTRYMILSVGSSDFTTVGASSNTVGLNFVATGAGSGTGTVIPVLTGTSVKIQGSATDTGTGSGTIEGLSKVIVYLTNTAGTEVLDLKNGGGAYQAPTTLQAKDMVNSGTIGSVVYPNTASYSNYFASIDTLGSSSTNGFPDSFMIDGNNDDWWVQFDTTKQSDGPVTVHIVVWDAAGNPTHYSQSAFISNYAPSLSSIVLGTDLTGAGTINATQNFSSGYTSTGFTARNKLLQMVITNTYGNGTTTPNGTLSYTLSYNGTNYWTATGASTSTTANTGTVKLGWATLSPTISDGSVTFTLTVTDSTSGGGQSYSQPITLTIHNNDTTAPTINLAPFGQVYSTPTDSANSGVNTDTGKTLGSVSAYGANIGTSGGHVEYTSPITSGASAVSGQVVFKGKAWDDESIQKITATIPGFNSGSEFAIATYSSASGGLVGSSGTGWSFAIDSGSQSLSLADGNVCNWSFTWDSSQVTTVAATNVTVTFKAYNSTSMSSSSSMVLDILPYVTAVSTSLSNAYSSAPSVFNRSAQGYYPIANTGVATLTGYNLYYSGSTAVTLNGVSTYITLSSQSKTSLTATLSSGATSGPLTLKVNGIQAGNNINSNSASLTTSGGTTVNYNQGPNGVNNQLLTDDLYFWVWSFNTVLSKTQAIRYPTMKVSSSGRVGFAYDYGSQEVHVNDNGTDTQIDGSFTQWYDTAFAYDGSGKYYAIGVNGDSGGGGSGSYNRTANTGFYAWQAGDATSDDSGGTYSTGTYKALIESAYNGSAFNSDRVQQPKIVTTGTASPYSAYMTYYDASQNQLTFRYGTVATGGTFGGAIGDQPCTGIGSYQNAQAIATSTSPTYGVGLYSAVGVTSGGVAVVAWYDQANQRLVFSYNTSPTSTTSSGQWQTNASVIDSSFAGWYVDMVVDAGGGIHIAYYNSSSGDLKYAYLSSYTATPQVVTVDSFLSTGTDIGISVQKVGANYVPYISYYMPTFTQTSYSVRTAWRTNFTNLLDGVTSDQYTQNWEVMTVPTTSYPQDFRVGIGFKSSSPVLGYSTKNGSTYTLETAQLQ
jgi:hypothetical protein